MAACVITENFSISEPPLEFSSGIFTPSKFAAIGHPPIPKHQFKGERMWQSVGASVSEKDDVIWAENDLANGASGPWCDPDGNCRVYGLTSRRTDKAGPLEASSPALLDGFDNRYDAVKNL